jgi:hypothetical protein
MEVRATTSEVAISSHLIIREFAGPFSYKAMPDFRAAVKNHAEARGNPYLELANEPSLCAGPFASAAELNEKLGLNHQRLAYMKSLPASFRAEHRKHSLLYFLVFILLKIVNPFVNLLGLEHKMPELGAVSKTQSFLAYPHLRENLARTFTREPKSYQRALALVERRIAEYEQRLSVIASSATE